MRLWVFFVGIYKGELIKRCGDTSFNLVPIEQVDCVEIFVGNMPCCKIVYYVDTW